MKLWPKTLLHVGVVVFTIEASTKLDPETSLMLDRIQFPGWASKYVSFKFYGKKGVNIQIANLLLA